MVNSQENKFSSEYIEERIEAFRTELLNIIRQTTDVEFQQYKESLAKIKLNDDNSMKDEVSRNWAEIITNEYAFDRGHLDVECLNSITKTQFLEFFEKHFHHTKKLSIQVSVDCSVDWLFDKMLFFYSVDYWPKRRVHKRYRKVQ